MSTSLAFAGKLLAPFAALAAKRVASRLGYNRWRIARTVRSRTGLEFPQREYRQWLRHLTIADFEDPVETAAPRLALALDETLAETGDPWLTKPGRMSAALRLIEATYAALLEILEGQSANGLIEHWARHRNEQVLAGLSELALGRGGWGRLDSGDLSLYLRRRSWERRAIRLEAVGVFGDARHAVIDILTPALPDVPAGAVRAVLGPFGAGKTEIAEAWHLACVDELLATTDCPIPIWLHARDLNGKNIERAVVDSLGSEALFHSRGAALVIDGVDEVDGKSADAIATDARVLVAGSLRSRVLITSRPFVLPRTQDDIYAPDLEDDQVQRLVEALGGRGVVAHTWPNALRESTKRPFFALAAATIVASGSLPQGQAGMIRSLVEHAMTRGSTHSVVTRSELFESLVDLAMLRTNTRAPAVRDFATTQRLLGTRLVTTAPAEGLQFSLPIFEQWFAAQALTQDLDGSRGATATRQSFDRWRWAIAIALSGADAPQGDALMVRLLHLNPGAAGWVLKQVGSSFSYERDQTNTDFDQVASRMLSATRTWVDSLGPLSKHCFPIEDPANPICLGLRIATTGWQDWAWSTEPGDHDEVLPLPPAVHWMAPEVGAWTGIHGGYPPSGMQWPWLAVQRDIARQTLRVLESETRLGGEVGIWATELAYHWCRVLQNNRTILHSPMARADVSAKVQHLMQLHHDPTHVRFVLGARSIYGEDLALLAEWLDNGAPDLIERPVPAPDRDLFQGGGYVWDIYSDERLVELASSIYGNACQAYDEIAGTTFAKFDWALGRRAYGPIGIVGAVTRGSGRAWSDGPSVAYMQLPLALVKEISTEPGYVVSSNGRAAMKWLPREALPTFETNQLRSRLMLWWSQTAHEDAAPFGSLHSVHSVFDTADDRPASELAASWMHADLKALALSDGTFPNLNR